MIEKSSSCMHAPERVRLHCLTFKKCPLFFFSPKLKKMSHLEVDAFFFSSEFYKFNNYFKHRIPCCYCVCKSWLSEIVWARLVHNYLHPFSSSCKRWTLQEEWHTANQQQLLLLPLLVKRKEKKNYEIHLRTINISFLQKILHYINSKLIHTKYII